jgi:hypothetical protein
VLKKYCCDIVICIIFYYFITSDFI